MNAEKKATRRGRRPTLAASIEDEKGRTILNLGRELKEDLEGEAAKQGWDLSTLARFALNSWVRARRAGFDIDTLLDIERRYTRLLDRLSTPRAEKKDEPL